MIVVEQSKRKISWLSVVLLTCLCVIFDVPYLSRNTSVVIILGMMVLYLVSIVNCLLTMENWKKNTMYAVCLFIALEAVYKLLNISSATVDYYFATIKFLFLLCAMLPIVQHLNTNQKLFLIAASTIALVYSIIDNIILSQDYTANYFATLAIRQEGTQTNVADTAFSSAVMLFSGVMVCWVSCAQKSYHRLTALLLALLSFYFLFTAGQRGIVLVLTLIMLVMFLVNSRKNVRNRWFWSVLSVIAVLVLISSGVYKTLLYWLTDLLGAERLRERVDSIVQFLESRDLESMDGSMIQRMKLILRSLQTFVSRLDRFLLGVGDHRNKTELVGNHSQFLDMLARYGIVGGAVFAVMFSCACKAVIRMSEIKNILWLNSRIKVLILLVILRGFLGNVMIDSVGVQMFVLIPLGFSLMAEQEEMRNA